jgi:hypothetical protein
MVWVAVTVALVGLLLIFSLPPDPWPYLGLVLVVLGPLIAVVAAVRSRRPAMLLLVLVTSIPLGLTALTLYIVANHSR